MMPQLLFHLMHVSRRTTFLLGGDLGPECGAFISEEQSPDGKPFIAVANEVSGSTTIFQINKEVSRR